MYHADLEPMFSEFITAHPRCPKDPDLPAVRDAIKEFMEEQAPSIFFKERWAASYNPARKVTCAIHFKFTSVLRAQNGFVRFKSANLAGNRFATLCLDSDFP